ncbi:MAG: type II secretion system F family protein, partial [Candidatus Riflebacteria bacterium]
MKKFQVSIQNQDGSSDSIEISAESAEDAIETASIQGFVALEAREKKSESFVKTGSVPAAELYHFTRLFGTLTRAGIPLIETLELLARRAKNANLQRCLEQISDDVKQGNGLKASFARHTNVFDKTYLQLVEVGEESGNLPQVLDRLTSLLRKKIQLRGMIIKALTYPVLVMVLSTVVVTAILVKSVPRFKEIY